MENGRADPIAGAVARAGRYRWGIVALLFTATVINYVDRQMIGVLKPTLSADLGWSETDFADVIFFFQFAFFVGDGHAAFFAKWRIGKYHIDRLLGWRHQGIERANRTFTVHFANAMQK